MPPRERPRARPRATWLAVLGLGLVLSAAVPATSSAFTGSITNSQDTASTKPRFTCADEFAGDARRNRAYFEFALDEDGGATTARDSSDAGNTGTYQGSDAKDAADPTACPQDRGSAYQLDGSTSRVTTGRYYSPITTDFSIEVWFKTTVAGGKLLGFEEHSTEHSDHYDKHFYINTGGRLVYGIYNSKVGTQTLVTPASITDGLWHHAVATTSSSAGSRLYLDGSLVAQNASFVEAEGFAGYWKLGEGNLGSWPDIPSNTWFTGSMRFAAAYPYVLTSDEIAAEASIGAPQSRDATPTPTPTPTSTPAPAPTSTTSSAATAGPSGG